MPAQTPRPAHSSAVTLLAVLLTAAACGGAAPTGAVPSSADCAVVAEDARPRIVFGVPEAGGRSSVGDAFDAGLYTAARFAGAQLHETLVRADCTGDVVAGLADEWSTDDGRIWRFRVTRGTTFADGTPVDAQSVVLAWSAARTGLLAGVTAAGQYDLRVALHAPADVRVFAMPALAVVRRTVAGWPAGTGPYAPDSASPSGILRLIARERAADTPMAPAAEARAAQARAADARAPDTIDVRTFGRDLRTAIDAGVDALVTGDAATIAYARARPDYSIASLPWLRTHVLATSPHAPGEGAAVRTDGAAWFPQEVVRVAARTALPPFWWQDCAPPDPAPPRTATDGRVLYARDDLVARAIAERITALARDRAPPWLRELVGSLDSAPSAVGVGSSELRDALRARTALAIVTTMPRVEYAGCAVLAVEPYALLLAGWHVTPLIDTRDNLIYRPGIGRVIVDGDGTIRFGTR